MQHNDIAETKHATSIFYSLDPKDARLAPFGPILYTPYQIEYIDYE